MEFISSVDQDISQEQSERVRYPVQHERYILYFQACIVRFILMRIMVSAGTWNYHI